MNKYLTIPHRQVNLKETLQAGELGRVGDWSGKTLDTDNPGLHPALCDLRKRHSCFLHPHQQVGEGRLGGLH